MTTTVAVLGLGAMGLPMATNLAREFAVTGFDISPERTALAAEAGLRSAADAGEAARDAGVGLIAVRNPAQLEEVLCSDAGVAPVRRRGSAVVLTSTVGREPVREAAARLDGLGLRLVDAPVSGGSARAGTGDLLVVVGADEQAWDAAHDVLELMSSTLVRVSGAPGDGQAMKTVNQLLCGVHIAAAGEALALARAMGLDLDQTMVALMGGAAESFMLGDRGPRMLRAYDEEAVEVRSRLDIFVKDMGIVTSAARSVGLSTPVAAAAEQLYIQGGARGLGACDDSSVIRVIAPSADR